MQSVDELRAAVLKLPVVERESLVSDLLQSLKPDSAEEPDADDWTLELLRRSDAFHSGQEPARPWRESMADIRRQFENGAAK